MEELCRQLEETQRAAEESKREAEQSKSYARELEQKQAHQQSALNNIATMRGLLEETQRAAEESKREAEQSKLYARELEEKQAREQRAIIDISSMQGITVNEENPPTAEELAASLALMRTHDPAAVQVIVPPFQQNPTFPNGHINWDYCGERLQAIYALATEHFTTNQAKDHARQKFADDVKKAAVMFCVFYDVRNKPVPRNQVPCDIYRKETYLPLLNRFADAVDYIYAENNPLKAVLNDAEVGTAVIATMVFSTWYSTVANLARTNNNVPPDSPLITYLREIGMAVSTVKNASRRC